MKQAEDTKTVDLLAARRGPYYTVRPMRQKMFGAYIAECRRARQMTQTQYAGSLNVSRRSLIMAEQLTCRPRSVYTLPTVAAFARAEFKSWFEMCNAHDAWSRSGPK